MISCKESRGSKRQSLCKKSMSWILRWTLRLLNYGFIQTKMKNWQFRQNIVVMCYKERIATIWNQIHWIDYTGGEENKKTSHEYAKNDEKTLLNWLENYKSDHLLFMYDFSVPFDNNMSERDSWKVKNRQKMSGGFRKESGNERYCSILTIVETLKRRNLGLIENLKKLFIGIPAIF